MSTVHPTAILQGDVQLADDVFVGPHCVLDGSAGAIRVGSGTRLLGNVYLTGPVDLGQDNRVYPFACLGYAPQDLKWDPTVAGAGLVVGNGNTFREHVTLHRATSDEAPTTVGDENYFMASSHAGHDCRIGNNCIFANATLLGGFVQVEDRVITGGAATVHQYVRLGRGAMLSGSVGASQDVPPWFMLTGINVAGSVNLVGLRRSGATADVIEDVRWVYKTLFKRGLSVKSALAALQERYECDRRPMLAEYIAFITSTRRGICSGTGKAARGSAAPQPAAAS